MNVLGRQWLELGVFYPLVRVHKKHKTAQADIWDNTSGSELTLHIRENSPCSHQYSNNKTLTWLHNCIHLQNWVSNNNLTTYQQVRTFPPALPVFWELNLLILSVQMDTHSSWAVLYNECLSRVMWLPLFSLSLSTSSLSLSWCMEKFTFSFANFNQLTYFEMKKDSAVSPQHFTFLLDD